MIQFLVALALCYVLIKIPFWILGSLRGSRGGRSMVGSLIRGVIAYKTFGLVRGLAGNSSSSSPRRPQRVSAGEASSGDEGGSRGLSVPNPVAAMRRWRQRRWSDPEPGMLPMKLRRPKVAHEIGMQRQPLGEEFDDPERVMPWQQESPSYTPGLLGPRGGINPNARREHNPRKVEHAERGMLNVRLRHNSRRVSTGATPMRRRTADEFDDPEREPRAPSHHQSGRGLLNPTGGIDPQARARNPVPEPIPPEPGMLGLTLHPKRPQPPPSQPAEPRTTSRRPRPQQALLNQRGAVTQNARARQPRRRASRPAGSAQQHQAPQTNQPGQQRSEGSERG